MLDRGCRDVAILHGLLPREDYRFHGYRRALAERGLPVREALVVDFEAEDWSDAVGEERTRALLARGTPFDGIFAPGVATAVGAARALHAVGRRVPDDVLVGCMGNAPWRLSPPVPLIVAEQPNVEMGARAVQCLVGILRGTVSQPSRQTLPCTVRCDW
jgi:LacI family transcriptional regulator